jgi:hypothetical protein
MTTPDLNLTLYLGGANVVPPAAPASFLKDALAVPVSDELFRALVTRALELIPVDIGSEANRSRLAHRWAAEALRTLAAKGKIAGELAEPYLHHLDDARDVRGSAEALLKVAPDLSARMIQSLTGASVMTVSRARASA